MWQMECPAYCHDTNMTIKILLKKLDGHLKLSRQYFNLKKLKQKNFNSSTLILI